MIPGWLTDGEWYMEGHMNVHMCTEGKQPCQNAESGEYAKGP